VRVLEPLSQKSWVTLVFVPKKKQSHGGGAGVLVANKENGEERTGRKKTNTRKKRRKERTLSAGAEVGARSTKSRTGGKPKVGNRGQNNSRTKTEKGWRTRRPSSIGSVFKKKISVATRTAAPDQRCLFGKNWANGITLTRKDTAESVRTKTRKHQCGKGIGGDGWNSGTKIITEWEKVIIKRGKR